MNAKTKQTLFTLLFLFSKNAWSDDLSVHESFTLRLEERRSINCSITIKAKIIEGTYLDNPNQTGLTDLKQAASSLEWNFIPTAKIYDDKCTVIYNSDFNAGHPVVIHAHTNSKEIETGIPHYFFYLSKNLDTEPNYKYQINWNGSLKWSHAQWPITEKAALTRTGQSHCFTDPKITICLD